MTPHFYSRVLETMDLLANWKAFSSLVAIVFVSASSFKSLLIAFAKPVAHLYQPHRFALNLLAGL